MTYKKFLLGERLIMKLKNSFDFYLILATTLILFAIALISIYSMFYFKFAQIHQMPVPIKIAYMNRMNEIVAPFIICLIVLLGICVPKRLLSSAWLYPVTVIVLSCVMITAFIAGIKMGLLFILVAALILQSVVLILSLQRDRILHFYKKGYWVRLGSSLIHFGLIAFILDLFFYSDKSVHLVLFWGTAQKIYLLSGHYSELSFMVINLRGQ